MSEIAPAQDEIIRMQQSIVRATEAVCGDPHADPLEVFPDPSMKERREDVVFGVDLSTEQEENFRAAMAELGPGRKHDEGLDEQKLSNETRHRHGPNTELDKLEWKAVLEGGQLHKVMAELELVLDQHILPSMIVVTGAAGRKIGEAEKTLSARLMGVDVQEVGDTEYDVERQFIEHHPNFKPLPEGVDQDMHCEYDLSKGDGYGIQPTMHGESNGQFVTVGTLEGVRDNDGDTKSIPVVFVRIDRFPDLQTPNDRPSNAQKMAYGAALRAPDEYDVNIGFVTSATYEPSCKLAVHEVLASVSASMTAQVLSYGTKRLLTIRPEQPKQPELQQLAGEAHKTAKMLRATA